MNERRWERHTVDIDRSPMSYQAPEKTDWPAVWWGIALLALFAMYCVWRYWPK